MEASVGLGLRTNHYAHYVDKGVPVKWVEGITENFLGRGGRARQVLERARGDAAVILHGVSMSIGGPDPLDLDYLRAIGRLRRDLEVSVVSDHLSFGSMHGCHGHDLWPLPLTEASLAHVAERVHQAQEIVGARLVLENPSTYLEWKGNTISEPEFFAALAERTGCGMLLDVNNVWVSAHNHGWDPLAYLAAIPANAVAYYHLAGHEVAGPLLLDTHQGPMQGTVLELYGETLKRVGIRPTIIEWDGDVPPLPEVLNEVRRATDVFDAVQRKRAAA